MTEPLSTDTVATPIGAIEVRRGGEGPPLVYLHSAVGEGDGLALLDTLATDFEVVAPMFPGFGASEGIEAIDDMEDATFFLVDLLAELGIERPVMAGSSLGAWMAAEVASRYPERLAALVLVNPVGLYLEGHPIKDIFGRTPAELAEDLFADHDQPLYQLMVAMSGLDAAELSFDMIRPALQTMAATARIAWDPYLHNPKLRRRLPRIAAPTLVVRGTKDTLVPAEHAATYAAEIPGARYEEIPEAGHMLALERPGELAGLVVDHLGI